VRSVGLYVHMSAANIRSGSILRKSRIEHIWSGLSQKATVNVDVPELSVRAYCGLMLREWSFRPCPLAL
jgi:hypothetical protein